MVVSDICDISYGGGNIYRVVILSKAGYLDPMSKRLGKTLRGYRERLKYSLAHASRETGVDFGFIRRIEMGEISPGLNTLQKLADGYNTTPLAILKKAGFK